MNISTKRGNNDTKFSSCMPCHEEFRKIEYYAVLAIVNEKNKIVNEKNPKREIAANKHGYGQIEIGSIVRLYCYSIQW